MKSHEARALLFQRKLAYEDYNEQIPGVPELDNQLGIVELRAIDTVHAEKLAKDENDERNEALLLGAMVAKSLVLRDTKERILSDTDIEAAASMGLSVLTPLAQKISLLSGIDPEALTKAKKSSKIIPDSDSHSASRETSGATHTQS